MGRRAYHPGGSPLPRGGAGRGDGPAHPPDPHPRGGRLRHLALVGCTASGKSALSLELARRLGDVEIVTVDSMQVYRGMDIGTAKPTPAEQAEIPHHLIDLAEPGEEWSLTRWASAARRAVASIENRGRRALLVGGTGLYFQAVVDGLNPPGRYPEVRLGLEAEPDTAALHRRLARIDPVAAGRMEPNNRRRVVRALEVSLGSGRPFSSYGPGMTAFPPTSWRIAGVWLPRAVVAGRIRRRLDAMVDAGLVGEVEALVRRPGGLSRTARQALGYREVLAHLEEGVGLTEAIDRADRRTRSFARRQRMWWRRDPRVMWFGAAGNPFAVAEQILGNWREP
ncbi:MAG TPA: tRNA (adenosine(37)-N6)-dimethylallyltransferase MiaA [Acidimicrobiales bacterium]|nr:tRNA (adenosine(37)-N6)-dimethylallyltransferase MiaA [Acidimicrobiales bacterium]